MRCALLAILIVTMTSSAQTSYPMVTHTTPIAIQRGKTVEITVDGQMNFAGVYRMLVQGEGVSGEVIATAGATPVKSVKLKLTATPDAKLGVREFRLASKLGISSVGQLLVVDDPVVLESAKNNTHSEAQSITLPCVMSGRIEILEDVDCFRFAGKSGQTITAEVFCARIQDKIHDLQKHADPLISLFDSDGRELAANDDFFFADSYLSFTLPKDGEYLIQIRDAKYDGDPRWAYALCVTDKPCVSHVFPMAVNPGQKIDVEPVGSAKLIAPKIPIEAPMSPGVQSLTLTAGGMRTNPVSVIVSQLPLILEQEPNDEIAKANRINVPGGVNGRIGKIRDIDYFVFKGIKGKAITLEVSARRFGTSLRSGLDAVLDILSMDGKLLFTNDDLNGKDPGLTFTPPADGDYIVRIRDLNSKGGDSFPYFLSLDLAVPDFTFKIDPSKAMIGPGSSNAWYVTVTRTNSFTGAVKIEMKGLPKGVTVNPLTILATMTVGTLVLTTVPDAMLDASNVEIIGTSVATIDGKEVPLTRTAIGMDEIYFPGGGRGVFAVEMKTVAITEVSDVMEVIVEPSNLVLKAGQEVKLDVTIKRSANFKEAVNLDIILRHLGGIFANPLPTGVTMVDGKSKTLIPANATKGHITLKVAPDAPLVENVPICVMANVSINFVVKVSHTSKPLMLTIQK